MDAVADALLAAVSAAPADDTPRLVYADYLDERGRPPDVARAEFIRVQCEHAKRAADDLEAVSLYVRAEELRKKYAQIWERPARKRFGVRMQPRQWVYRRGFVASILTPMRTIREYPDDVFAIGPLEHIRLSAISWPSRPEVPTHLSRLTAITLPEVDLLRLDVRYLRRDEWLAAFADVPVLLLPRTYLYDRESVVRPHCDAIAAGRLSPVVALHVNSRFTLLDPLRLWNLFRPSVAPFADPLPEVVFRETRAAESVRYRHLVRHYGRAGWPPPAPLPIDPEPPREPERAEPAPRSLLSRVAGWLRGR